MRRILLRVSYFAGLEKKSSVVSNVLVTGDGLDLGNSMGITEDDTNLRGSCVARY